MGGQQREVRRVRGSHPYYCGFHGTSGTKGVIFVR